MARTTAMAIYSCPMEEGELLILNRERPFGKGPYYKATMDIPAFSIIYEDKSLITGPGCSGGTQYVPICLGCNEIVEGSTECCCCLCGWPLCGQNCPKKAIHENNECQIFAENGVEELFDPFQYELIRILRCLLTRSKSQKTFQKLKNLHGAIELRKKEPALEQATRTACMFIRENCKLVEFDAGLIDKICGVVHLQTRAFGRTNTGMEIFPFASNILHSCDANTRFIDTMSEIGEPVLRLITIRDVKKDEPLTQHLMEMVKPSYIRKGFLVENFYFYCTCPLCMDITERGTFFSAVTCQICLKAGNMKRNKGYILPVNLMELCSVWKCNQCDAPFGGIGACDQLNAHLREYNDYMRSLSQQCASAKIKVLKELIRISEKSFHPSSYMIWLVKRSLLRVYTESLYSTAAKKDSSSQKIDWDDVLELFNQAWGTARYLLTIIQLQQPGGTVTKGEILYDLVQAAAAFYRIAMKLNKTKLPEAKSAKDLVFKNREEVMNIFRWEEVSGRINYYKAMREIVTGNGNISKKSPLFDIVIF